MSIVLISGGHAGIGFECAKHLSSRSRCDPAADLLRTSYGVRVMMPELDTASLASVRKAVAEFRTLVSIGKVAEPGAMALSIESQSDLVLDQLDRMPQVLDSPFGPRG